MAFTGLGAVRTQAQPAVPTAQQLEGTWEWVSTVYPWTQTTSTPESEGYRQSLVIDRCASATLCLSWLRDGAPVCCETQYTLPSDDPSQTVSMLGGLGFVRVDEDVLTFDDTAVDGPRHTLRRVSEVPIRTGSWSTLKSQYE